MQHELLIVENLVSFRSVESLCLICLDDTIIEQLEYFSILQLHFCFVVGRINKEHCRRGEGAAESTWANRDCGSWAIFEQNGSELYQKTFSHRNGRNKKANPISLTVALQLKQMICWIIYIKPWIATTNQIKTELHNGSWFSLFKLTMHSGNLYTEPLRKGVCRPIAKSERPLDHYCSDFNVCFKTLPKYNANNN